MPKKYDGYQTPAELAEPSKSKRWVMRQRRLGNCICCGQRSDRPTKDHCSACLDNQRIKQREYFQRIKTRGGCRQCGGELTDRRFVRCERCRQRTRGYWKKYAKKKKSTFEIVDEMIEPFLPILLGLAFAFLVIIAFTYILAQ